MPETKLQRLHRGYAGELHRRLDQEFTPIKIPAGWHEIWCDRDHRDARNQRVTLTLDADVVRFFKSMGARYQPRINRVLRAFMHDRLAGLVAGPETRVMDDDMEELRKLMALIERDQQS